MTDEKHEADSSRSLPRLVRCEGCDTKITDDESNTMDVLAPDGTHETCEFCDECAQGMREEHHARIDGIPGSSLADRITQFSPNTKERDAEKGAYG